MPIIIFIHVHWMHDAGMYREYDLAFLSVKRVRVFFFWHRSVHVAGCNNAHYYSEHALFRDPKLWFQLLDMPDFEKFFADVYVRART